MVSHDRDFLDRVVTQTLAFEGEGEVIVYAGGYSDVETQRALAKEAAAPALAKDRHPAKPKGRKPKVKDRLSYKEERELEALAAQVEALGEELAQLDTLLADPDAYTRDPDAFDTASRRSTAARDELAAAEERWLELEMLREELAAVRDA